MDFYVRVQKRETRALIGDRVPPVVYKQLTYLLFSFECKFKYRFQVLQKWRSISKSIRLPYWRLSVSPLLILS